jgi:hypothetical protein
MAGRSVGFKGRAMRRQAMSHFGLYSAEVEKMMCAGEPLTDVEDAIESAPLPEEQRAALWLVAWSLNERPVWRRTGAVASASPVPAGSR